MGQFVDEIITLIALGDSRHPAEEESCRMLRLGMSVDITHH